MLVPVSFNVDNHSHSYKFVGTFFVPVLSVRTRLSIERVGGGVGGLPGRDSYHGTKGTQRQ